MTSNEDLIVDWLIDRIATMLEVAPMEIAADAPFVELGLASLQAVELSDELQRWTALELPPTLAFDYPTIDAVGAYVAELLASEGRTLAAPGHGALR